MDSLVHAIRHYTNFHQLFTLYTTLAPRRARQYRRHLTRQQSFNISSSWTTFLEHFISYINHHHFPVNDIDLDYITEIFPYIPIPILNYDLEDDLSEAPLPIQIAAIIEGHYASTPKWTTVQAQLGPTLLLPRCLTTPHGEQYFQFQIFKDLCQQHPSPIRDYPLIFTILDHSTGNLFVDLSHDDYYYNQSPREWTLDDIETLTIQWKVAERLFAQQHKTVKQLETHPQHWKTIFTCLAKSFTHEPTT